MSLENEGYFLFLENYQRNKSFKKEMKTYRNGVAKKMFAWKILHDDDDDSVFSSAHL